MFSEAPIFNAYILDLIKNSPYSKFIFNNQFLAEVGVFNNILFGISGVDNTKPLNFEDLIRHVNTILAKLYEYKKVGFVNPQLMNTNEIYNLFRSYFIKHKDIFTSNKLVSIFELEHYHNLILLLLILEIDSYLGMYKSITHPSVFTQNEQVDTLKELKRKINQNISAP